MGRVLIVEDDQSLAVALRDGFEYDGYSVSVAPDGAKGWRLASEKKFDVVILDLMLPNKSGLELCDQIRKSGNDVPIIILSARTEENDKVLGLKLGADDYMTKPFSFMELMARVEAVLRRVSHRKQSRTDYQFDDLHVNLSGREVSKSKRPVELSSKEFDILAYFIERRGEVVTRDQLLDVIWGYEKFPFTRTVDVHVAKLRRKIEDDPSRPKHLLTIHGTGYKFIP